jgi:hypothetical protein
MVVDKDGNMRPRRLPKATKGRPGAVQAQELKPGPGAEGARRRLRRERQQAVFTADARRASRAREYFEGLLRRIGVGDQVIVGPSRLGARACGDGVAVKIEAAPRAAAGAAKK